MQRKNNSPCKVQGSGPVSRLVRISFKHAVKSCSPVELTFHEPVLREIREGSVGGTQAPVALLSSPCMDMGRGRGVVNGDRPRGNDQGREDAVGQGGAAEPRHIACDTSQRTPVVPAKATGAARVSEFLFCDKLVKTGPCRPTGRVGARGKRLRRLRAGSYGGNPKIPNPQS